LSENCSRTPPPLRDLSMRSNIFLARLLGFHSGDSPLQVMEEFDTSFSVRHLPLSHRHPPIHEAAVFPYRCSSLNLHKRIKGFYPKTFYFIFLFIFVRFFRISVVNLYFETRFILAFLIDRLLASAELPFTFGSHCTDFPTSSPLLSLRSGWLLRRTLSFVF